MNPKLRDALTCHRNGKIEEAKELYKASLKSEPTQVAIQNLLAICRTQKDYGLADSLYKGASSEKILSSSILLNYGNICMDRELYMRAIQLFRKGIEMCAENNPEADEMSVSLCNALRNIEARDLCMSVGLLAGKGKKNDKQKELLLGLVDYYIQGSDKNDGDIGPILDEVEEYLEKSGEISEELGLRLRMTLGISLVSRISVEKGYGMFSESYKIANELITSQGIENPRGFLKGLDAQSWNMSLSLLKKGWFKEGWALYEHGLNVKASGPQRWQRSLVKVFSSGEVPIPTVVKELAGKRVLVMGEQGIGDTMMFAQLLPRLTEVASKVYFCPGIRLEQIYRDSLKDVKIVAVEEVREIRGELDCQIPIGSLTKFFFSDRPEGHEGFDGYLVAKQSMRHNLARRYKLEGLGSKPLIGVSWQGGGKKGRIEKKSIQLERMVNGLVSSKYDLVSLQYGDDARFVKKLNERVGRNVLYDDPEIDAMKDMDLWLAQVSLMDGVVSIANTTIHGAGGLNVPTYAVVTKHADWRWLEEDIGGNSLWYSSVRASYQRKNEESLERQIRGAKEWAERLSSKVDKTCVDVTSAEGA